MYLAHVIIIINLGFIGDIANYAMGWFNINYKLFSKPRLIRFLPSFDATARSMALPHAYNLLPVDVKNDPYPDGVTDVCLNSYVH